MGLTRLRTRSSLRLSLLAVLAVTAVITGCTRATGTGSSQVPPWPSNPQWERDVMAPNTPDVLPVRVLSTSGSVTGAKALTNPATSNWATLTMKANRPPPSIVVDYGKDVGGVPYFVVRSESKSPVLSASYSEGLQYLGPGGDQSPSASQAGDPVRVDDVTLASPGRLSTGFIQGGERYERITLTTPGTLRLSSIGIAFSAVRATAKDYRGWFDSSSTELNRIWFDGAYTTQLDELPADAVPPSWRITDGALYTAGDDVGVLDQGLDWTNYTTSFDLLVMGGWAGWVVRASSSTSGYLFLLNEATGNTPSQDTLEEIALGPGEFTIIGDVDLPPEVVASGWHRVAVVASGTTISTSIDGRQVATFDTRSLPSGTSAYASGTVGFTSLGPAAMFRDLAVTAPGGKILYTNDLSRPSALADFPGPQVTAPDPLPVIMDGAKRDRVVWSGDLGVEVPNVFYTTGTASFVRESLQLLASYQVADGESGTNVNPTVSLGQFPQPGSTYSASYSMDEVNNIATYYLFTGDVAFVRSEWPMITRELAYNRSMVDNNGLLVTDDSDGSDWDYYDGAKVGEVTAYNDIYYETLMSAASMANALGLQIEADLYRQQASRLRKAINSYLVDPTTGLYALSNLQSTAVAQDGNSLAVLFGVAPREKDTAILATLWKDLPSTPYGPEAFSENAGLQAGISPFVTNEEVDALFATGQSAAAISLIQKLWGYMDAPGPDYTGADWEYLGTNGTPGFGNTTSLAHGWASGATADLSSYVLGVQPSTAGFKTWSVKPHPGTLSWVEGNVPTPHGTIEVRWAQKHSSGRFILQVTAPPRTEGTISVPVPRSGALVTVHASTAGRITQFHRVVSAVPGGTYVPFTVKGGATYEIDVTPRTP